MMKFNTHSGRYFVTSHGNGWAYEVIDLQTGDSLWFQDDDANQFEAATQNLENEDAISIYFESLC